MPELTGDMFALERPRCKMGRFLDELDEKSRAVLNEALANSEIGNLYIHEKLKAAGFEDPPKDTCIRKHRQNNCRCPS